eukprot:TRINITY_DN1297_c0_g2_i10.p1 TRINITY_DN1297_c0_g2~~TRINITY_DN1297_c0_g2_i10.p1  ORF type:complete len:542 (-),score=171.87 TRINITY_DN1297_c0_g2_i10:680-2305(-)
MKSKGMKLDYNRTFFPISDLPEFEALDPDEINSHDHAKEEKANGDVHAVLRKKHEIVIPMIKKLDMNILDDATVIRLLNAKRKRHPLEYIRLAKADNLPRPDLYEASDKDVALIEEINAKLATKPKASNGIKLTVAAFEAFIRELEIQTDRYEPVPLESAKLYAEKKLEPALQEYVEEIYNHWRSMRQQLKRSLLRTFWKANISDDTNPRVAFRPREKEKMKLRRSNKGSDISTVKKMQHLRSDLEQLKTMIEAARLREKLKSDMVELNFLKFEAQRTEKLDHVQTDLVLREVLDRHSKFPQIMKKFDARHKKYLASKEEAPPTPMEPNGVRTVPKPVRAGTTTAAAPVSEDQNFALASLVCSIFIEARSRNIKPEYFKEILALATTKAKPEKVVPEEAPVEKRAPTPVQLPVPVVTETTKKVEKEPPKTEKNIFELLLRKRITRDGRIVIDRLLKKRKRVFTELDAHPYYGQIKDYRKNQVFGEKRLLPETMIERERSSEEREILERRNRKFEDILCTSDQEDDHSEVFRSLRRMIKSRK